DSELECFAPHHHHHTIQGHYDSELLPLQMQRIALLVQRPGGNRLRLVYGHHYAQSGKLVRRVGIRSSRSPGRIEIQESGQSACEDVCLAKYLFLPTSHSLFSSVL